MDLSFSSGAHNCTNTINIITTTVANSESHTVIDNLYSLPSTSNALPSLLLTESPCAANIECSICQEKITPPYKVWGPCKHIFCANCADEVYQRETVLIIQSIRKWHQCPLCRQKSFFSGPEPFSSIPTEGWEQAIEFLAAEDTITLSTENDDDSEILGVHANNLNQLSSDEDEEFQEDDVFATDFVSNGPRPAAAIIGPLGGWGATEEMLTVFRWVEIMPQDPNEFNVINYRPIIDFAIENPAVQLKVRLFEWDQGLGDAPMNATCIFESGQAFVTAVENYYNQPIAALLEEGEYAVL